MNRLCILATFALPLTSAAQAPRAAIVVEEDGSIEPDASAVEQTTPGLSSTDSESNGNADTIPAKLLEDLLQLESHQTETQTEKAPSQLPQQPDDLVNAKAATPKVSVQTESSAQITLSDSQSSSLKLLTPWAPKPMQPAPLGWRYIPETADKSYPLTVTLSSGKTLSLKVAPYALVPVESSFVVQACEPGYQPERGYQQDTSISARLENTTQTLETAAESLNESIKNLSSLVDSLPQ